MASVFRPSRIKNGRRVRSRYYSGKYPCPTTGKPLTVTLRVVDKDVALKKLHDLQVQDEREAFGISLRRRVKDAAQRPLSEYLQDLMADLRTRGKDNEYFSHIEQRVKKLLADCGWVIPRDISSDAFIAWRRKQTFSPRTLNHYLDAARRFVRWIDRDGSLGVDVLSLVDKVETRGREKVRRRALSDEEACRLIEVSGERAVVYLLALQTGLRRDEIRQLCWGDIFLDAPKPYLVARASTTKNRKEAVLRLIDELAAKLKACRPVDARPSDRAVRRYLPKGPVFRADLEAAGIPRMDDSGRVMDFHALRHTFITNLQRAGVPRRAAMELARHSDSRLTDRVYTDPTRLATDDSLELLPRFVAANSPIDSPENVPAKLGASQAVTSNSGKRGRKPLRGNAVRRVVSHSGTSGHNDGKTGERGIRTPGTVTRTHAFQACSFSHSDISPRRPAESGGSGAAWMISAFEAPGVDITPRPAAREAVASSFRWGPQDVQEVEGNLAVVLGCDGER